MLTAPLGAFTGTNPDTANTLAVTLAESGGTLLSGTAADAAAARTLCWVDGEFVAYTTATLTAANAYGLTGLYRGLYGTGGGPHAAGAQFVRLDGTVFVYPLPQAYIGTKLYLKLVSFNAWGKGIEDISTVTPIAYVPLGTGFYIAPPT